MIIDINGRKFTGHSRKACRAAASEAILRWLSQNFVVLHPSPTYWEAVNPDGRCQHVELIDLELPVLT